MLAYAGFLMDSQLVIPFVVVSLWLQGCSPTESDYGQTELTKKLNAMVKKGRNGVYTGGKGVIVRSMTDDATSTVVPASLIVNDIMAPSTMYVSGNPFCPSDGNSGYNNVTKCTDDPFALPTVGSVIGTQMQKLFHNWDSIQDDDWHEGVFYGTDSNSVDQRCRWLEKHQGYDCPGGWIPRDGQFQPAYDKKGAGNYASGNPTKNGGGGGAGCHFASYRSAIDQFESSGIMQLVSDRHCQCNLDLKTNSWGSWVQQWKDHGKARAGFEWMGWFGKGKSPSFGAGIAACWVNNPRDMIQLQNALWSRKDDWNNLRTPIAEAFDDSRPSSQRRYWGWNEVPLDSMVVNDPANWDAIVLKLPAAACGDKAQRHFASCMSTEAQMSLEKQLHWYENKGYLRPGKENQDKHPGSYVVLMRERYVGYRSWERDFFCESWQSPKNMYSIAYRDWAHSDGVGACYVEYAKPHPSPPSPPPPPEQPGPIRFYSQTRKCIDVAGGNLTNGNVIWIWDCDGLAKNQNWQLHPDGSLSNAVVSSKCIDLGDMSVGRGVWIWDCNGLQQQKFTFDASNNALTAKSYSGEQVCITLPQSNTRNGIQLEVHKCDGSFSQRWKLGSNAEGQATTSAPVLQV
jgi:hypothetical protein